MTNDDEPYLICNHRSNSGDVALWWREAGKGYTQYLDDAGRYTKAAAMKQQACRPEEDYAIPLSVAEGMAARAVLDVCGLIQRAKVITQL